MAMRRNTLAFALFAAAAVMWAPAFAKDRASSDAGRIADLKVAEAARFKANVDADSMVLGQVLDEDLEYVHSNGEVNSKKEFIMSLVSGKRDYVATTFQIQGIRLLGDVAIVRGTAQVTVSENGKPLSLDIGYTDVWVWKDRRWQMTAWRSARMPAPVVPAPAK
jgi:hypothetical protein